LTSCWTAGPELITPSDPGHQVMPSGRADAPFTSRYQSPRWNVGYGSFPAVPARQRRGRSTSISGPRPRGPERTELAIRGHEIRVNAYAFTTEMREFLGNLYKEISIENSQKLVTYDTVELKIANRN
jgi:hypothetical protein